MSQDIRERIDNLVSDLQWTLNRVDTELDQLFAERLKVTISALENISNTFPTRLADKLYGTFDDAIDSAAALPDSKQAGRYTVIEIEGKIFIRDTETNLIPAIGFAHRDEAQQLVNALNNGQRYFANSADVYEVGKFINMHSYYATEADAQAAADSLNAESGGATDSDNAGFAYISKKPFGYIWVVLEPMRCDSYGSGVNFVTKAAAKQALKEQFPTVQITIQKKVDAERERRKAAYEAKYGHKPYSHRARLDDPAPLNGGAS